MVLGLISIKLEYPLKETRSTKKNVCFFEQINTGKQIFNFREPSIFKTGKVRVSV